MTEKPEVGDQRTEDPSEIVAQANFTGQADDRRENSEVRDQMSEVRVKADL